MERLEERCLLAVVPDLLGLETGPGQNTVGVDSPTLPSPIESVEFLPTLEPVFQLGGYLTAPSPAPPLQIALDFISTNAEQWGLSPSVFEQVSVTDHYVSQVTGTTHVYLKQTFNGLEVGNAVMNANVDASGRLINVGGGFVPAVLAPDPKSSGTSLPASNLSATQAIEAAADALGYPLASPPSLALPSVSNPQAIYYAASSLSLDPIPAQQHYVATAEGLRLAWNLVLRTPDLAHWYDVSIDVRSGDVLLETDWIDHAQYNVFPAPLESPADGSRSLLTDPHDATASPFGWHDTNGAAGAEFTDTRGNNVFAQEDADHNNTGGARPSGGTELDFDFPLNLTQSPSSYQSAAITNLFYWNNLLHDVHYQYGFDEAAGNFQFNNYGNGGLGGDPVQADAQDGAGFNNANFGTPPDGQDPRMQMFLFTTASPQRDGDFDNGVIVHEYGHGVSNRLTGGPANSNALDALQSGGMGEGWGDFWALMFMQRPTDTQNGGYSIGTYVLNQAASGNGFRHFPYSFDMSTNPTTYGRFNTSSQVHDAGEIWASALWDLNWLLIDKHGFNANLYDGYATGGNNLTLQLVMDGLKLQPANPSFLDGRDAILLADQVLTGGANQDEIWQAFARRGMGQSASDGGSADATTVTEAFDVPSGTPAVSVSVGQAGVLEDNAQNLVYTFRRMGQLSDPITVNYSVAGSATLGVDYTASSPSAPFSFSGTAGTVTFPAFATTATVILNPAADTILEPNETVVLTVTAGTGYDVSTPSAATGTILFDEVDISVAVSPSSVLEDGSTNLVYTFTRAGVTTFAQSVNFSVSGTAAFGTDYTQSGASSFNTTSGTVLFAAGASTATVTLNPTSDVNLEANETAILTITAATQPPPVTTEIEPNNTLATAQNIDGGNWNTNFDSDIGDATTNTSTTIPHVTINGTGNGTFDYYSFTVLSAGTRGIFDIDSGSFDTEIFIYNSAGVLLAANDDSSTGTGAGGSTSPQDSFLDFVFPAAGTYTIGIAVWDSFGSTGGISGIPPPAGASYVLHVSLTDHLSPGYRIATPNAATGTIVDDDTSVSVTVSPVSVAEDGTQSLIYTFSRAGATSNELPVNFSVGGAASFGTDYSETGATTFTSGAGTVTFAAGASTATVAIDPTSDTTLEPNESVSLTIQSGPGYDIASPSVATGTIATDDIDLQVSIVDAPDPYIIGSSPGNLVYTVTVTNAGNLTATGVGFSLSNSLPAGVTFVSAQGTGSNSLDGIGIDLWDIGTLTPGNTATLTVTYAVAASTANGATVSLTAGSLQANQTLANTGDDTDSETTTIARPVDLAVSMSGPTSVVAGSGVGNAVYLITVRNNGPASAAGVTLNALTTLQPGVAVESVVASSGTIFSGADGTGLWTVGTLAVGAIATLRITLTVGPSAAIGSGVIGAGATMAAGTGGDTTPGNNTAAVSTSITRQVDLAVSKSGPASVVAGSGPGNVVYVLTVRNLGVSEASGVTLSAATLLAFGVTFDSATTSSGTTFSGPDGTGTWIVGTLAPSASATLTVTLTASASAVAGTGVVGVTAAKTAVLENDSNSTNDAASASTSIVRQVDLEIVAVGPPNVVAGSGTGNVVYLLSVRNAGVSEATGVVLSTTTLLASGVSFDFEEASAGTTFSGANGTGTWTVGTLAPGDSATLTITLTAGASAIAGPEIVGVSAATLAVLEGDTNSANDLASANTSILRQADLVVTQSKSIDTVAAGSGPRNLTYVVTVENAGPSSATQVAISETMSLPAGVTRNSAIPSTGTFTDTTAPDGIWSVGTLLPGESATLTIQVTVDSSAASGVDVIGNTAAVLLAGEALVNTGNDESTALVSVNRQIDLAVTQSASSDSIYAGPFGDNLVYVVTVANAGLSDATEVGVDEALTLPDGVTRVSVVGSGATSFEPTVGLDGRWLVGSLPRGASETLTIVFAASAAAANGNLITSVATISASAELRVGPADDSATETTPVFVADFGDAPESYGTHLANDGARHLALGATLGPTRDAEGDGQPNSSAAGDDSLGDDDEDGLLGISLLKSGLAATATVNVQGVDGTYYLSAWIDFNRNGVFADPGEQIAADLEVSNDGDQTLSFVIPDGAIPGASVARFRLSTTTQLSFDGLAPDGEVEDHAVVIHGPGNVSTRLIPDPAHRGGNRLEITGDEEFNQLVLDLGGGGAKPLFKTLALSGLNGTTIDGLPGAISFSNITGGVSVQLLGGDDVLFINGSRVAGPIALDGGLGDDTYFIAATRTKFALNDDDGLDTLNFSNAAASVNVDLAWQDTRFHSMRHGNTLKLSGQIENLIGSRFSDRLRGNAADNVIIGGAGNDDIDGRDGSDTLLGGVGKDKLKGSAGDDVLDGGDDNDRLDGGLGDDLLRGGAGNDTLTDGGGRNVLLGEAGNDKLTGGTVVRHQSANTNFDLLIGGSGVDKLTAGKQGNSILIAGTTDFDTRDDALQAILREWSRQSEGALLGIDLRVTHLTDPENSGLNGNAILRMNDSIQEDDAIETLVGRSGGNLFFQQLGAKADKLKGQTLFDRVKN